MKDELNTITAKKSALVSQEDKPKEENIPQPLILVNTKKLQNLCREYLEALQKGDLIDSDIKSWVFELAIETFYGEDVWSWINQRIK